MNATGRICGHSATPDRGGRIMEYLMKESMIDVKPCKPVAAYIGGKSKLASLITGRIEQIPHTSYAEAFVGMGGIFLRRRQRPKAEIINDYNMEVATFFRVLQRHYQAFLDMIRWQITTRAEFKRLVQTSPSTLTDLERAARFLYLQRLAFGGKPSGMNFGVDPAGAARFDLTKLAPMLEDVHERLSRVVIECLDYKVFIKRYDREDTLFYLDPPYYGSEKDYGRELFCREEFAKMAALLRDIKGSFILSLNDRPETRKIFADFYIESIKTTYTIAGNNNAQRVGELLISNQKFT